MLHAGDTRRSEDEVSDLTSKGTSCDVELAAILEIG
jgi:hypothetical protein